MDLMEIELSKNSIIKRKLEKYGYERHIREDTFWFKGYDVWRKYFRSIKLEVDTETRVLTAWKNKRTWAGSDNYIQIPIKPKWVKEIEKYFVIIGEIR